jgi:transcriptional regulator with XRE-family HTH domain
MTPRYTIPQEVIQRITPQRKKELAELLGVSYRVFYDYYRNRKAPLNVVKTLCDYFGVDADLKPSSLVLMRVDKQLIDKMNKYKMKTGRRLAEELGLAESTIWRIKHYKQANSETIKRIKDFFDSEEEKEQEQKQEGNLKLPDWIKKIKCPKKRNLVEQEYYCNPERALLFSTMSSAEEIFEYRLDHPIGSISNGASSLLGGSLTHTFE